MNLPWATNLPTTLRIYPARMKVKSFFWLRVGSTLIDLSIIYCAAIVLQLIIGRFVFIAFVDMFVSTFLIYYVLSYLLFLGRTPAKMLTGIRVFRLGLSGLPGKNIVIREILAKGLLGLILPIYVIENLFQTWSSFLTWAIVIVVLVISLISLLMFKRTWWEKMSGTSTKKNDPVNRKQLHFLFVSMAILIIGTIWLLISPFSQELRQASYRFAFKYPVTNEVKAEAAFIRNNSRKPVDYIFDLFNKYDIVVLSERLHTEYTQYELISQIVTDRRFEDRVGNIFTEIGSVSFQDTLNRYLNSSYSTEDELNKRTSILQRNGTSSVHALWDATNLFDLLKTVNKLNCTISDSNRINWYFTDLTTNWETTTSENWLRGLTPLIRDSLMEMHIIQKYRGLILHQRRKKALVIMNTPHSFGAFVPKSGIPCQWMNIPLMSYLENKSTTARLMNDLPGKIANVMINTVSQKFGPVLIPVQNGKWETAFALAGNPAVGFDFAGSPFGGDSFDEFYINGNSVKYKDIFTGFVFYQPLEQYIEKSGFPYEFDYFEDTLLRRASCIGPSEVSLWKRKMDFHRSHPQNPVYSEFVRYGLIYNVLNAFILPFVLVTNLLITCIIYLRNIRV